ncbi:MAG: CvpA family protein [Firmicutes bacterium]|nr:CvpA family protein [Bacillota bacterium]
MSGPLATDLIIAGVILLFALIGYFRGLIKSLMGLAATAASVYFAYVFSGQWAERVTGILFPSLSEDIAKSIDFSSMSVTLPVIGEVGLDRLGIDTAELTQAAAEKITAAAMGIMQPLVRVIVFLVLLILFVAATKIVLFLLDKVMDLPVLSTLNKTLGAVFGFAEGFVLVLAVIAAFDALKLGFFHEHAEGTVLLSTLLELDPIRFEDILPMIKDAMKG